MAAKIAYKRLAVVHDEYELCTLIEALETAHEEWMKAEWVHRADGSLTHLEAIQVRIEHWLQQD